jgi:diaminohydroxyphosphoribosylaminopyrimidine deaminase/5-amino-6-(5-phosphoribosylamino)uracil reductase
LSNLDSSYIRRCLQLANKARGTTSPNPMVGALLVKQGRVIGEGFHVKSGEGHAEVNAIANATETVEGSTLYCSLEPCCHSKKLTPPCTELIIKSGIKKVVVATLDPNPEVAGKGLAVLSNNGIETSFGYCEEEANELNKVFFKSIRTKLPYIHLKVALTMDGRIASESGDSKWISSPESRAVVHDMRLSYDAVMIGRNTANLDNPKLTARVGEEVVKTPKSILIGNSKGFNADLDLLKNPSNILLLHTGDSLEKPFKEENSFQFNNNFSEAFEWIKSKGVHSVLVEGGSHLVSSIIDQDLYDELTLFICPKLIGNGPSFYNSARANEMKDALDLKNATLISSGNDIIYKVKKNVYWSS